MLLALGLAAGNLTLAQIAVEGKSNESTAIPQLLALWTSTARA
jgi:hypothetical protein